VTAACDRGRRWAVCCPQHPAKLRAATSIPALGLLVTTRAEGGVQIVALASGGTAERANMHAGYVVTSIDGRAMPGPTELETELQNRPPGTKVRVGYMFRSSATNSRMYYSSEAVLQLPVR
jgi:S1-C subfamily serine protease